MKKTFWSFFLFSLCLQLHAQAISSSIYNFSIEPPVEWEASSDKLGKTFLFTSADKKFSLILSVKDKGKTDNPQAAMSSLIKDLGPQISDVQQASFLYNNYPSALGSYIIKEKKESLFAFLLCIIAEKYEYWLHVSFQGNHLSNENLALLYSALDSFALGSLGRITPGPITQFDAPVNTVKTPVKARLNLGGQDLSLDMDKEQAEAAQRLVEREALIMSRYKERNTLAFLAWVRYYRFIYRDNYMRLQPLVKLLQGHMRSKDKDALAAELLPFCQNYSYERFSTPSDLIAPYASILSQKGDCDSSALTYLILLNHMQITGALLLSQTLGHAVVGVLSNTEGTSMQVMKERYVIAELTTKQPLGTVPAKVANTKDWFPIIFTAR